MKKSELAKLLRVPVQQIDAWCRQGMPHHGGRSNRKRQFNAPDVYTWLIANGHAVATEEEGNNPSPPATLLKEEGSGNGNASLGTGSPTARAIPPSPQQPATGPILEAGEGLILRTRAECAQFFGVHVRTVASWLLEPDFPGRAGDKGEQNGYFPASRISQWMQARARSSAAVPNPTRQKLEEVKLAQAEHKLLVERGQLVPLEVVAAEVQRAHSIAINRLLALPDKLVELLPADTDERLRHSYYEAARDEVRAVLHVIGRAIRGENE